MMRIYLSSEIYTEKNFLNIYKNMCKFFFIEPIKEEQGGELSIIEYL